MKLQHFLREAQQLSPNERVKLVEQLLDSLDQTDPTIDQAWLEACHQRAQAVDQGDLALIDFDQAVARLRQKLS
ncbi:addiction module protein [Sulfurivirga sp.]|uniref:addiction module protein n=1 Tax=Sulfurivirga sp. TaxID=2614236 RepID=UPI0025DACFE9|nr:addiction module protein [Sulfurivirga sp.]